jgi:hypothetical protein
MAKSLSVPTKNLAKVIRNVASQLAPRDTGNLRNVLRQYNTPERMTKVDKSGNAKITLFFAPPGARYGAFWNDPAGKKRFTNKVKKKGGNKKNPVYTTKRRYPQHFDYAKKAYASPEVNKAVNDYKKALGVMVATELRQAVQAVRKA